MAVIMLIYSETQECYTSPYITLHHAGPPTYELMQTLGGQGWPGLVCVLCLQLNIPPSQILVHLVHAQFNVGEPSF